MATRWSENETGERAFYDHGAQFFTVRDAAFQMQVDDWLARGLVREWARGFADASGQPQHDGHPRYCAVNGMNSLARDLVRDLTVATNAQVASLQPQDDGWRITMVSGASHTAAALLLTPPVEQSLALLDAGAVGADHDSAICRGAFGSAGGGRRAGPH